MSDYYWAVYKALHDAPGTPKELKCIGCRVAAGGACVAASGLLTYGAVKKVRSNIYVSGFLGLAAFFAFSTSLVAFRMASDDYQYNQRLVANHREYLRKTRLENTRTNKSLSQ